MKSSLFFKTLLCLAVFINLISCKKEGTNSETATLINLSKISDSLELFAEGFISTDLYERDFSLSPNGDQIIYTLGNYDQTRRCLVSIRKVNGIWSDKVILPFSGVHNDIEPFFSPHGDALFFASNRPISQDSLTTDYNIWMVSLKNDSWGEPKHLGSKINSGADEYYPSVSKNGNLYFTSTRDNGFGREDIFVSEFINGDYQEPRALDENINTASFEFNAFISPDESMLVFGSFGREDGLGGGDLYISKKDSSDQWGKSRNLGSRINSEYLDFCPFIDFVNGNFYFSSNRTQIYKDTIRSVEGLTKNSRNTLNGMSNIYRIDLKAIDSIW